MYDFVIGRYDYISLSPNISQRKEKLIGWCIERKEDEKWDGVPE
jgi:hypothetical protein